MAKTTIAKLFQNGRSRDVCLPPETRSESDQVSVRRDGNRLLLDSIKFNVHEWFAKIDRLRAEPFMKEGRSLARLAAKFSSDIAFWIQMLLSLLLNGI